MEKQFQLYTIDVDGMEKHAVIADSEKNAFQYLFEYYTERMHLSKQYVKKQMSKWYVSEVWDLTPGYKKQTWDFFDTCENDEGI